MYVAAGTVYSLEAELNDLEECARGVSSAASDMELSYLEERVASAAGKVKQSELQVRRHCEIWKVLNVENYHCFSFLTLKIYILVPF